MTILHRPQYVSKSCVRGSGDTLMCNLHKFSPEFSTSPQMKHFRTIRPFSFSPFGNNRLFLPILPFLPYFAFSACFGLSSLFSRPDLVLNIGGAAGSEGARERAGEKLLSRSFSPGPPLQELTVKNELLKANARPQWWGRFLFWVDMPDRAVNFDLAGRTLRVRHLIRRLRRPPAEGR